MLYFDVKWGNLLQVRPEAVLDNRRTRKTENVLLWKCLIDRDLLPRTYFHPQQAYIKCKFSALITISGGTNFCDNITWCSLQKWLWLSIGKSVAHKLIRCLLWRHCSKHLDGRNFAIVEIEGAAATIVFGGPSDVGVTHVVGGNCDVVGEGGDVGEWCDASTRGFDVTTIGFTTLFAGDVMSSVSITLLLFCHNVNVKAAVNPR